MIRLTVFLVFAVSMTASVIRASAAEPVRPAAAPKVCLVLSGGGARGATSRGT